MSDDLVKEAREMARYRNATKQDWSRVLEMQADLIETLQAERDAAITANVKEGVEA